MVQTRSQTKKQENSTTTKKTGSVTNVVKKSKPKASSGKKKPKYKSTITETKNFPNVIETTMQISRSNGTGINVNEFEKLYAGIRQGTDSKLVVRALNGQRWFTFKGYSDDDLNIDSFENYYQNKVSETGKFENFSIVQITSLKPKAKIKKLKN